MVQEGGEIKMGDRISIQFKKGNSLSVVLFSHWGGKLFLKDAQQYVRELKAETTGTIMPLDRLEPH